MHNFLRRIPMIAMVGAAAAGCGLSPVEEPVGAAPLVEPVDEAIRAEALGEVGTDGAPASPPRPVDGPVALGDDADLDRLWHACDEGSGVACDQLFARAPIGSEYEQFGVSCGARPDVLHCTDLDRPPADDN